MKALAAQLDVLLEPEREVERAKVRAQEKQRASLQRFRIAVVVLMLGAGAISLWFISKREKLRLMSEVENAKAAGQETLGNLDTCIASYVKSQSDNDKCKQTLSSDKKDYEERLESQNKICRTGGQQECINEMNKVRDLHRETLKACREDTDDVKGMYDTCSQDKQRLTTERDEQKSAAEQKQAELKTATEERDKARADVTSCQTERDELRKQIEGTKQATPTPLPTPTAPNTVTPASTGSPSPPSPSPSPTPPTGDTDETYE